MVSVSCALLQAMINGYGVNVMAACLERLLRQFIDHCSVLPILFSLCFLSYVGGLTHGIPFLLYIRYPPSFLFELLDNLSKSCFLVLCPGKDKKRAFMLLHINALTLFYYKIVLAVVPYKLEFDLISMVNMLPLSAICSN